MKNLSRLAATLAVAFCTMALAPTPAHALFDPHSGDEPETGAGGGGGGGGSPPPPDPPPQQIQLPPAIIICSTSCQAAAVTGGDGSSLQTSGPIAGSGSGGLGGSGADGSAGGGGAGAAPPPDCQKDCDTNNKIAQNVCTIQAGKLTASLSWWPYVGAVGGGLTAILVSRNAMLSGAVGGVAYFIAAKEAEARVNQFTTLCNANAANNYNICLTQTCKAGLFLPPLFLRRKRDEDAEGEVDERELLTT